MANTSSNPGLRTQLGRVRGLGSAKAGSHHWWLSRLSSLALIPLTLWFVFGALSIVGDGHAAPMFRQGQWQRDGAPIPDATGETYQIQAADAGRRIGFLETATDSHGARRQMSNEIAIGGTL